MVSMNDSKQWMSEIDDIIKTFPHSILSLIIVNYLLIDDKIFDITSSALCSNDVKVLAPKIIVVSKGSLWNYQVPIKTKLYHKFVMKYKVTGIIEVCIKNGAESIMEFYSEGDGIYLLFVLGDHLWNIRLDENESRFHGICHEFPKGTMNQNSITFWLFDEMGNTIQILDSTDLSLNTIIDTVYKHTKLCVPEKRHYPHQGLSLFSKGGI
jgi:hypothetical protein